MDITYLVTTDPNELKKYTDTHQIFMVDGRVPDWMPGRNDHIWDHHRKEGAKVQIEEMPDFPKDQTTLLEKLSDGRPALIVTTQVDADACVAAAWLQLKEKTGSEDSDISEMYYAIAYECDHLFVPENFKGYKEFAAKAVAALKIAGDNDRKTLGLPANRKEWGKEVETKFYSDQFKKGTNWLIESANYQRAWPGESGEADQYWDGIENDAQMLVNTKRISLKELVPFINLKGINRYFDIRGSYTAIEKLFPQLTDIRPYTLTISIKEFGTKYSLGSNPAHPNAAKVNYSANDVWKELTKAEAAKRGISESLVDEVFDDPDVSTSGAIGFSPWGGRDVVGGSGWNHDSQLTPEEVVAIVLKQCEN